MKKLKSIIVVLAFISVTACGFTPMLKDADFSDIKIKTISYTGSSGLTYFLKNNINLNGNKAFNDGYNVKISINESAVSHTKSTAGLTTEEKVTVNITFDILDKNNKKIGQDSISGSRIVSVTNNVSTDEETKRIEKENIITNLIQKLTFSIRAKILSNQQ